MAALDYTVCLFSEIFVTTQGGNFPHFLMGHRRFLYGGHSKTIKPDKGKLAVLLEDRDIRYFPFLHLHSFVHSRSYHFPRHINCIFLSQANIEAIIFQAT